MRSYRVVKGKRARQLLLILLTAYSLQLTAVDAAEPFVVDDFEGGMTNKLGGRTNTYVQAPSRALALQTEAGAHGGLKALLIKYDKKDKGGPYDSGGWCGYYTLVKAGPRYFDATPYQALSFWVKGGQGGEDFAVGLADRHWDEIGDSVKSESVTKYLPAGKITAEWQKAAVPLSVFMVEQRELASVAVCFEGSLFPGGGGKGSVYIDDLMFE